MAQYVSPLWLVGRANTWAAQQSFNETLLYIGSVSQTALESPNAQGNVKGTDSHDQFTGSVNGNVDIGANSYLGCATVNNGGYTLDFGAPGAISNPTIASGTVYQNTANHYLTLYVPAYAATSGTAGTFAFALGTTSTPSAIWTDQVGGSTSSSATRTFTLRIPPGLYWSVTVTNATLGTPTQIEE